MREELNQAFAAVRVMWKEGRMDDKVYMKCLVGLAHDWMVLGDVEEANALLAGVTEEYLRNELPKHMEQDPTFALAAYELAGLLHDSGVSDAEPTTDNTALLVALARPANA